MPTTTLSDRAASFGRLLLDRVARTPELPAFMAPDGSGGWTTLTWRQTGE